MPLDLAFRRERTWHRSAAKAMGCECEILVDGDAALIPLAFARLRELEARFSRFLPESELNQALQRPEQWVDVSSDLFSALRWSVRLNDETAGRFDPTIRTALETLGYDRTFREIDTGQPLRSTAPAPGLSGLRLEAKRAAVWIPRGVSLDLGGIGKGLAADIVVRESMKAGATAVYVSFGGDIQAAGEAPEGGWNVPLLHPVTNDPIATHNLTEGALVMSTVAIRSWTVGGLRMHHIIDPHTGKPTSGDVIAVAVATRSAARAEGLAKAAIVAGLPGAIELLRTANVTGWVVTDTVTVVNGDPGPHATDPR